MQKEPADDLQKEHAEYLLNHLLLIAYFLNFDDVLVLLKTCKTFRMGNLPFDSTGMKLPISPSYVEFVNVATIQVDVIGICAKDATNVIGFNNVVRLELLTCTDFQEVLGLKRLKQLAINCPYRYPLSPLVASQNLPLHDYTHVVDLRKLPCMTSLEVLQLEGSQYDMDLEPVNLLSCLHTLSLDQCHRICYISPLRNMICLRDLNLHDCTSITDFATTLPTMTSLEKLDIGGWTQLDNLDCLRSLTLLQKLLLSGCQELVDISAVTSLQSLQTLDLWLCLSLTELYPLLSLACSLRTLHLTKEGDDLEDQPIDYDWGDCAMSWVTTTLCTHIGMPHLRIQMDELKLLYG